MRTASITSIDHLTARLTALAERYSSANDNGLDADGQPRMRKWPGWARVLIFLGCIAGSWTVAMGLVAIVTYGLERVL